MTVSDVCGHHVDTGKYSNLRICRQIYEFLIACGQVLGHGRGKALSELACVGESRVTEVHLDVGG